MSISPQEIANLREGLEMTQEDFAARLMISRNYVSLLEGGKKTPSRQLERRMKALAGGQQPAESTQSTVPAGMVMEEPTSFYEARAPHRTDNNSSVQINPAFALPVPTPTQKDCLNYLAAYLAEAGDVPHFAAHTLVELKKHFKISEARRAREAEEEEHQSMKK